MTVVRAAITQVEWTGDKESMIAKHEVLARDAATDGDSSNVWSAGGTSTIRVGCKAPKTCGNPLRSTNRRREL